MFEISYNASFSKMCVNQNIHACNSGSGKRNALFSQNLQFAHMQNLKFTYQLRMSYRINQSQFYVKYIYIIL